LEVQSAAHVVAAPVGGQVLRTRLTIGHEVLEGEELVVLDAEAERRALLEKRARRDALAARRQALQREIQAEQEALEVQQKARRTAGAESRAQVAEAEARAQSAEGQAETSARLRFSRAASAEEVRRDKAEAEARRAAVNALTLATSRLDQDRLVGENGRKTRLAKLERETVELDGEMAIEDAASRRLEHEIALRTIRAPVAGEVAESAEHHVGAVVHVADKLGAIVPPGEPRAVALFPASVVGRIHPGQPARLRLEGFPWTQYGTVAARVAAVGNEPQAAANGGLIRVEFALIGDPTSPIPRAHGLPGSAEVEVERVAPAILLLRAAGQFLGTRRSPGINGSEPRDVVQVSSRGQP
jgi:membrane fusion protein (multidrug efflux system)